MASETPTFAPGGIAARLLAALPRGRVVRHRVSRGASLFRQGDPVTAIFVIETGRVRMARVLADGTAVALHVADAGESFAEAALSAAHYHCDAIAETDAVVLALPKGDLLAVMANDPAECLALMLALAAQVRELRARLELRDIRSASERVLAWLRLQAAGTPARVSVERSWTRIAEELGLSKEAVYRSLAMLERQQRISRAPGVVWLPGLDGRV